MNRDERRDRTDAGDLRVGEDGAWPVDPRAGGTWLGVHRDGRAFALLNQYPASEAAHPATRSRGELIPAALRAGEGGEAMERVARACRPFLLVQVGLRGPWRALRWDGRRLERRQWPRGPRVWTSSSLGGAATLAARRALFRAAGSEFEAAHRTHLGPPADGPCVHRDAVATVAFDRVTAGPKGVLLEHRPGPACEIGETFRVEWA